MLHVSGVADLSILKTLCHLHNSNQTSTLCSNFFFVNILKFITNFFLFLTEFTKKTSSRRNENTSKQQREEIKNANKWLWNAGRLDYKRTTNCFLYAICDGPSKGVAKIEPSKLPRATDTWLTSKTISSPTASSKPNAANLPNRSNNYKLTLELRWMHMEHITWPDRNRRSRIKAQPCASTAPI